MLPVDYMPNVKRYFKKLKDNTLKNRFKESILNIRNNPYSGEAKNGDLKGLYCIDIFHNGINYELAYRISKLDNGDFIIIIMAGTRENFYKDLKRYLK